jgi:hypothetical protein
MKESVKDVTPNRRRIKADVRVASAKGFLTSR